MLALGWGRREGMDFKRLIKIWIFFGTGVQKYNLFKDITNFFALYFLIKFCSGKKLRFEYNTLPVQIFKKKGKNSTEVTELAEGFDDKNGANNWDYLTFTNCKKNNTNNSIDVKEDKRR